MSSVVVSSGVNSTRVELYQDSMMLLFLTSAHTDRLLPRFKAFKGKDSQYLRKVVHSLRMHSRYAAPVLKHLR